MTPFTGYSQSKAEIASTKSRSNPVHRRIVSPATSTMLSLAAYYYIIKILLSSVSKPCARWSPPRHSVRSRTVQTSRDQEGRDTAAYWASSRVELLRRGLSSDARSRGRSGSRMPVSELACPSDGAEVSAPRYRKLPSCTYNMKL